MLIPTHDVETLEVRNRALPVDQDLEIQTHQPRAHLIHHRLVCGIGAQTRTNVADSVGLGILAHYPIVCDLRPFAQYYLGDGVREMVALPQAEVRLNEGNLRALAGNNECPRIRDDGVRVIAGDVHDVNRRR
jgi:hypothetical protein